MSELVTKYDEIYLQVCDDEDDEWCGNVTWCQDRIHDADVKYIRADLVESLRQQLSDHLKREVVLREVLKESVTIVGRGLSIDVWTKGQEALADTDDLSVYILCERVPVAFFYEHAVTKETVLSRILDDESRKRGWKTTILYSAWEPTK